MASAQICHLRNYCEFTSVVFHNIVPVVTMQISRTVGLHDSHKAKLSFTADLTLCRIAQLEALQACTDSDVVQGCMRQAAEDL